MTFLEFVCESLLGPPATARGDGQSTWDCPRCGKGYGKFHTRPHKPEYKDRFSFWSCQWWGDEAELMRFAYPAERYPQHLCRLEDLRAQYEREGKADQAPVVEVSSSRGTGSRTQDPDYRTDCESVASEWAALTEEERGVLVAAVGIARGHKVELEGLAWYAWNFVKRIREREEAHRAVCTDPKCDAAVCRRARGWTEERIREAVEESQRRMREQRAAANGRVKP
jgi:hypothetical protein